MKLTRLDESNFQEVIEEAKLVLEKGGLVVFPSDTVYGLAANALSSEGVSKLFQFKDRPQYQSVSIAIKNLENAQKFVVMNDQQKRVLQTLLPGPYTIALKSKHQTDNRLEAEDQTLGVRLPAFWFTQALSETLPFPYTATSANLHSKGPHHSIEALFNTLSEKKKAFLDLVIDYGTLPPNQPSTVLNLSEPEISVLRQGDYSYKQLAQIISHTPDETQAFAQKILEPLIPVLKTKAIAIVLQGDLGAGKTIFTKGLGYLLNINNVVSPTFVIYYEYVSPSNIKLQHFDLYRIENEADLKELQIPKLLKPNNLLVFEWGERVRSITSLMHQDKAKILLVKFKEIDSDRRQITVYKLS